MSNKTIRILKLMKKFNKIKITTKVIMQIIKNNH